MKMIATKMGFHGGTRIRKGQEFEAEPAEVKKWAVPKDQFTPDPEPGQGPSTFSEMARAQAAKAPYTSRGRKAKDEPTKTEE